MAPQRCGINAFFVGVLLCIPHLASEGLEAMDCPEGNFRCAVNYIGRHRKPVKHFPPRCVRVSRGDGRGCWTEGRHTLSVDRPLQSARSPAKPKEPFLSSLLLPHDNVRGHSSFLAPSRASDERACISIATPRFRLRVPSVTWWLGFCAGIPSIPGDILQTTERHFVSFTIMTASLIPLRLLQPPIHPPPLNWFDFSEKQPITTVAFCELKPLPFFVQ